MNILSFDLEEWYNEQQLFAREWRYKNYDDVFARLMDQLDIHNLKATFFCVGKLVEMRPDLLRQLSDNGHEVGCHSNVHTWLNKMTREECEEDTRIAIDSLEQCIGKKVKSYRAPAFSIGASNPWAFEVLAENGIENDASIFPAAREFGGFSGFPSDRPCIVSHNGISLHEFPICVGRMFGRDLVFSGGGYFRLLPKRMIINQVDNRDYTIWYFHLIDMISEKKQMLSKEEYEKYFKEPGTFVARHMHFIKNSIGAGGAFNKLSLMMGKYQFENIAQAASEIEWSTVKFFEV